MSRPTPASIDALVRATARHNAREYAEIIATGDLRRPPELTGWSLYDADDHYVGWVEQTGRGIRFLHGARGVVVIEATWAAIGTALAGRIDHGDRDSIIAAWIRHTELHRNYTESVQTEQEIACGWPHRRPVPAGLSYQEARAKAQRLGRELHHHDTQVLAPTVDLAVNRSVALLDLQHA